MSQRMAGVWRSEMEQQSTSHRGPPFRFSPPLAAPHYYFHILGGDSVPIGGCPMSRETVGARQLEELREVLSGRDLAVVGQIADLRLMSSRQVQAVHFPDSAHDNPRAAAQACQRCLARLTELRLLTRAERRIGGVRAGSAAACFGLGPVGQRVLNVGGPRRRFWESSAAFVGTHLGRVAARRGPHPRRPNQSIRSAGLPDRATLLADLRRAKWSDGAQTRSVRRAR